MFMAIILIKVHHYIVIIHSDPFNLGYQIFSGVQVMTQWYAPDKKKSAAVKDRSESLQEAYVFFQIYISYSVICLEHIVDDISYV